MLSCAGAAAFAFAGAEQPGALEVYPPTARGCFNTTLDHFRFDSDAQLCLRYFGYDGFADTSSAPVVLYTGNEGALELFYNNSGGVFELARAISARVLFIEHRYYGGSLPFGAAGSFSRTGLRYLSIEQAYCRSVSQSYAIPCREE